MKIIALLALFMLLCGGVASGHNMFVGQRLNVDISAIFENGEPARNADVNIYRYNETIELYELYNQTVTDSKGMLTVALPGKGTGNWRLDVSCAGHKKELFINISTDRPETKKAGVVAAAAVLPIAFVTWWRRNKR